MRPSDGPPARLRADLQLSEEDGGVWRIADPVLGRQMRFAGQESRMLAALRGEPDMAQPVEEDFLQALERLHLLEGRGPSLPVVARMRRLLLTPLTDRPVRSQPLSPTQAAQAQLLFCPEVRYRCAGCGICCHSFLLGPLRSPDVDRLERLRWPAGARLPVGRQALHYLEDEGEAVPFLRTFKGRCVFLGSEGLCEIHRQEGG
ncbi:MAG: YkgJ family cysteine cluster protein, partial [Deltaproteobacteria bacterium]|nr:YkgJ family cysteine cluster protein [Deltaproteobacteria bacterium]